MIGYTFYGNRNGVGTGNGGAVIQEFALKTAADQLGAACFKEQMAASQGDNGLFFSIGTDFFYLVQGGAGRNETEGAAFDGLQRFPAERQTGL